MQRSNKNNFQILLLAAVLPVCAFAQEQKALRNVEPGTLQVLNEQDAREAVGVTASYGTESKGANSIVGTAAVSPAAALPVWTYSVKAAQDGKTYSGSIVGTSPLTGSQSTTVPTILIPVILKITQGGTTYTFDPTAADAGCLGNGNTGLSLMQASPLFQNTSVTMNGVNVGTTQYIDALQRGEFWTKVNGGTYHLLLSPTVNPALTLTVNAGTSGNSTAEVYSVGGTQCGTNTGSVNEHAKLGIININTLDVQLASYITAHGLTPAEFPFFVLYNSVISNGSANNLNNCCILGYHNATAAKQTYGIADFEGRFNTLFTNTGDISVAAHELGEWANDPFGNNPTPAWGHLGQVSSCQNNLEVGDPLSGTLAPSIALGGFTYHPQELAFYSWFYGGTSLGTGGKFSTNGTFKGSAKLCPPGGTN